MPGRITAPRKHRISLGLMGKFAALRDAYASIDKAIEHAATHLSVVVDMRSVSYTHSTVPTDLRFYITAVVVSCID